MIYPNYYLDFSMPDKVPENVKNIIDDFMSSAAYQKMITGQEYYDCKNSAIMQRCFKYYSPIYDNDTTKNIVGAELLEDIYRANNIIASGFVPLLVDQLNQYLLGKPIKYEEAIEKAFKENILIDYNSFADALYDAAIDSQNKSIGWVYFYVQDDKMKFRHIPSEQVLPLYDETGDNVMAVVRVYIIRAANEKGDIEDANIVEIYDSEKVTAYIKFDDSDDYKPWNCYYGTNQKWHITVKEKIGEDIKTSKGSDIGRPPFAFIEYKTNGITILDQIKSNVDIYDIVKSDFANNFEDFQEAINVIKGYNGTDLKKVNEYIKKYATVLVDPDNTTSGFERDVQEIPYQARKEFLQIVKDDIYEDGMGVNTTKTEGQNLTNVVIKAKYSLLDLKASWFAQKIETFFEQARVIINVWLEYKGEQQLDRIIPKFDKTMIMNEIEKLGAIAGHKGIVSDQTLWENDPIVADAAEEKKRMDKEKDEAMERFNSGIEQNTNSSDNQDDDNDGE